MGDAANLRLRNHYQSHRSQIHTRFQHRFHCPGHRKKPSQYVGFSFELVILEEDVVELTVVVVATAQGRRVHVIR